MLRAFREEQGQDLSPEGLGLIWGELKGWWAFQATWEGVHLLKAVSHEGLSCGHPGKCVRGDTVPSLCLGVFGEHQPCLASSLAASCWHCLGFPAVSGAGARLLRAPNTQNTVGKWNPRKSKSQKF